MSLPIRQLRCVGIPAEVSSVERHIVIGWAEKMAELPPPAAFAYDFADANINSWRRWGDSSGLSFTVPVTVGGLSFTNI